MSAIAIITARGGSKRIPKKNIKEFCGRPVIAYSIDAALHAGCFSEVMVSTDSDEIARIAKGYGAKVPFMRSKKASNDYATTADVLLEVIEAYGKLEKKTFDVICCIYPAAPFVTGEKLKKAMELLESSKADSVIPVVPFSFPPQRGFVIESSYLRYSHAEYASVRSQDLQPIYHDCGQFYVCRAFEFLKNKTLLLPKSVPLVMPEEEVQDIDNLSDWKIAELKYRKFIAGEDV